MVVLDSKSWTVHSLVQKPQYLCLSHSSDTTDSSKEPQCGTRWYCFLCAVSQTSKQPSQKDGVRFTEVLRGKPSAQRNTTTSQTYWTEQFSGTTVHLKGFCTVIRPPKIFVCEHQCKPRCAVYQKGIGVVGATRWKPDLKAIWFNPTYNNWKVWVCSVVSNSVTLWTVAHQVPLSMGLSRQEYWTGLPFPPPGDLPDPGTEPRSPVSHVLAGRFFIAETPGKPITEFHLQTKGLNK